MSPSSILPTAVGPSLVTGLNAVKRAMSVLRHDIAALSRKSLEVEDLALEDRLKLDYAIDTIVDQVGGLTR